MAEGSVTFVVNGVPRTVDNPAPWLTLNEWLRAQPKMKGTKRMCAEGGCGACVVMVTETVGGETTHRAVNSCLYPVCGLDGAAVTTVEGLGGSNLGTLHPIQQRVVDHNASQCGFCTPGIVMNMYSLLASSGNKVDPDTVEHAFDGNICRCTGYRPILDAMKSFCTDADPIDIEDLRLDQCKGNCPGCPRTASTSLHIVSQPSDITSDSPAVEWYRPATAEELVQLLTKYAQSTVRIVAGDTGKGVYKNEPHSSVYIDIKALPGATDIKFESNQLTLGACVTFSKLIDFLESNATPLPYFTPMLSLLKRIANTPVRNSATWAGSFILAHLRKFTSGALTAFAALSPSILIINADGSVAPLTIEGFLMKDMRGSVIQSITVPPPAPGTVYAAHKVMKRHENSHAYVNASFSAIINTVTGAVSGQPLIFYGGLQPSLYRAVEVETYLVGKSVFQPTTISGAVNLLRVHIPTVPNATSGSVQYRCQLADNLLYKFFVQAAGSYASPSNVSALWPIRSGVSSGKQSFDSDKSAYPISESVPKLEIRAQATGEALYVFDAPTIEGQMYGAFVMATAAPATINSIDSSKALAMPGVVKFVSASDIPGTNDFSGNKEEIFASSEALYVGQAIGMIVADSAYNAEQAALAVTCSYTSTGKPIFTIPDAIAAQSFFPDSPTPLVVGDINEALAQSAHRVSSQASCGSQHHFYMETQSAFCVPLEDGMDVYSSTQTIASVQPAVASSLAVPQGSINVIVKRCGGGFGGKLSRAAQVAAAAAVAAKACNTPVMVHTSIDTNLSMIGKRFPWQADYSVGFDDDGLIKGVECILYADAGCNSSDLAVAEGMQWISNAYNIPAWNVIGRIVRTHTASNTACRAPGSLPAMFFMETMIEHVAWELGKSPDEVRAANFYKKGEKDLTGQPLTYWNLDQLWSDIETSAELVSRTAAIAEFNKANRWKKRGISRVPTKFGVDYEGAPFSSLVAVYAPDGTVAISHAGIEIGQGLNTKVAQVAAATLGIPVSLIHIKASTALCAANTSGTGGSVGSELTCQATLIACTELKERIDAATLSLPADATWRQRIGACADASVDLTTRGWYKGANTDNDPYAYNVYGVMVTEVEADILTGETNIVRADILYDCGRSVNPELDIGQIEGAMMMGFGYWLTEEMIYDSETGANLTHNTWEYKPPMCLDVPQDLRVSLLKDSPNPLITLRSKGVGEPPLVMTCSALFAARNCVRAALESEIDTVPFFPINGPATPDVLQPLCQAAVDKLTV